MKWMVLSAAVIAACGSDAGGSQDGAQPQASRTAQQPAGVEQAGTFEHGDTTYRFQVTRCDLTGTRYEGILLHGLGETPDGRRISVEVERADRGDWTSHNVMVAFGSLMDGDVWTASTHQLQDGRWFADESAMEPADGPLLEIADDHVTAAGTFKHERDGRTERGTLRATCAS